jgi:hypothetical protein
MVQPSATRCSCHNPSCCFSTSVYCCLFRYDSVQKLLDTPSYIIQVCNENEITNERIFLNNFVFLHCIPRLLLIYLSKLFMCNEYFCIASVRSITSRADRRNVMVSTSCAFSGVMFTVRGSKFGVSD